MSTEGKENMFNGRPNDHRVITFRNKNKKLMSALEKMEKKENK